MRVLRGKLSMSICGCGHGRYHPVCPHQDGYFRTSKEDCRTCPVGAKCEAFTNVTTIKLDPGYWRTSTSSSNVLRCRYSDLCIGEDQCRSGHQGPYCRVCAPNYYRPAVLCTRCQTGTSSWVSVAVVVVALVLFVVLLRRMWKQAGKAFKRHMKCLAKIIFVLVHHTLPPPSTLHSTHSS